MATKTIRQALRDGKRVTFHRHITGCDNTERLPVYHARLINGQTFVKIGPTKRGSLAYGWAMVQDDQGDWISIEPCSATR